MSGDSTTYGVMVIGFTTGVRCYHQTDQLFNILLGRTGIINH